MTSRRALRALTIALALAAIAASWLVFAPKPAKPPAAPPPGYLEAKGAAFFAAAYRQFSPAPVALRQFEGQPLVAYFWATWCAECREAALALLALRAAHRGDGLVVIGIGIDQSDKIERFTRDNRIDYPMFVGGAPAIELSKKMGNLLGEMPFVAAIDRRGRVSAVHLGKFESATPEAMAAAALE